MPLLGSPRTVAVAHPDEFISYSLARGLRAKGFRLHRFDSARDALLAVQTLRLSALLVALDEPEMGRLGLLHRVRQGVARENLPIVVVSDAPNVDDTVEAYRAGADLVLSTESLDSIPDAVEHLLAIW